MKCGSTRCRTHGSVSVVAGSDKRGAVYSRSSSSSPGTGCACSSASASGASGSSLTRSTRSASTSSSSASGKASCSCSWASASGTSSRSIEDVLPGFGPRHNAERGTVRDGRSAASADARGLALREDEPVGRGVDHDRVTVPELTREQLQSDGVGDLALQYPPERPGPEVRVLPDPGDVRP